METKKEEKPLLKAGDKLLVVVGNDDGTSVIHKALVCSVRGSDDLVYERTRDDGSVARHTSYFREEGSQWCRGWTGKAAQALRSLIAKRALLRKQAETARDRKYEDDRVVVLRRAARIVARAKLPRELRPAAFQIAFMGGMGSFFLR